MELAAGIIIGCGCDAPFSVLFAIEQNQSTALQLLVAVRDVYRVNDNTGQSNLLQHGANKKGWMEILPRFKIQYPMKNRGKNTIFCRISYAYFPHFLLPEAQA